MTHAYRRPDDDLGANTMPHEWPPRHDFLSQFMFAPVGIRSNAGGGNNQPAIEKDGVRYLRPNVRLILNLSPL